MVMKLPCCAVGSAHFENRTVRAQALEAVGFEAPRDRQSLGDERVDVAGAIPPRSALNRAARPAFPGTISSANPSISTKRRLAVTRRRSGIEDGHAGIEQIDTVDQQRRYRWRACPCVACGSPRSNRSRRTRARGTFGASRSDSFCHRAPPRYRCNVSQSGCVLWPASMATRISTRRMPLRESNAGKVGRRASAARAAGCGR